MSPPLPLILLPPSEGKASGGDGPAWARGTMSVDLDDRRAQVMLALRRAMRSNQAARAKLLGVKGEALAAATSANRTVASGAVLPAIDRYTGVLYGALDAATLGAGARRRLDDAVLIVSGLWGLVAPGDAIPDYKLKMGAALPGLGRLSTWWRPAVDEAIADVLSDSRRGPVWNLLPKEHAAAWSAASVGRTVYSVRFLEPGRDDALVAVAHWNKFLKGALVRFLVEHRGAGPEELVGWEHPSGFVLDPSRTAEADGLVQLDFVRRT